MSDDIWGLWHTLDSVFPMPISRTRDRIMSWLFDARERGLITPVEHHQLAAADWADRVEQAAVRKGQVSCFT